jgi:hypothetical protein
LLLAAAMVIDCAGSPGPAGPAASEDAAGAVTVATEPIQLESCSVCHSVCRKEAGDKHQASYDELYQDGAIQVTDLAYAFSAPDTTTVTFNMTKNGVPFDAREADSLAIYFAPYTGTDFQFVPAAERPSLLGDLTCDGAAYTSTPIGGAPDISNTPGLVVLYGTDEIVGTLPGRIRQGKYPFVALLEAGGGVDYVSAANNDGCEKCHTDPYLKHGYIYSQVNGDPGTDFHTCKVCHLDNSEGGHFEWQLLVDDPPLAAAVLAGEVELTPEQQAQYAYNTSLMNDVHMSHAMDFPILSLWQTARHATKANLTQYCQTLILTCRPVRAVTP